MSKLIRCKMVMYSACGMWNVDDADIITEAAADCSSGA